MFSDYCIAISSILMSQKPGHYPGPNGSITRVVIDLCHAFEYLMLALCKNQKWKEMVKISEYRKFGDLIPKSTAFVKVLKTENLTKNIWEFYHADAHTFPSKILGYF